MRRTLLLGVLLGILISAAAALVLVTTLPSDKEIQEMSLEELGLSDALNGPFGEMFQRFIEQFMAPVQERIRDRVVDDVYQSVALAAGVVVVITAGGAALIAADSRRRSPGSTDSA
jgi:hypothetical protein